MQLNINDLIKFSTSAEDEKAAILKGAGIHIVMSWHPGIYWHALLTIPMHAANTQLYTYTTCSNLLPYLRLFSLCLICHSTTLLRKDSVFI